MAKRKKGGKTKDVETLIFTDLSTNWSDSSTSNEIERTQVVPRIACEVDELAARIPTCSVCDSALLNNGKAFTECIGCQAQSHLKCVGLTNKQLKILSDEGKQWNCRMCTVRMENSKRAADASIIISDQDVCDICGFPVREEERGLFCEVECKSWYHASWGGVIMYTNWEQLGTIGNEIYWERA